MFCKFNLKCILVKIHSNFINCYKNICYYIWQGDSGSPVTFKHGDQHILAGVVNHGNCYNVSVFARVAFHRTYFLDKVLKGATVCKHGVEAEDWF